MFFGLSCHVRSLTATSQMATRQNWRQGRVGASYPDLNKAFIVLIREECVA